jgi:hypothetical protein
MIETEVYQYEEDENFCDSLDLSTNNFDTICFL